jgi:predicted ATPase
MVFQDRWTPSIWYEPSEVSDGSMIVLAFLTLAHMQKPPHVLAIEEPEYALHPYLVSEVIGMLRKLATGELGAPVQVLLATHSAELLNFAEPKEVRFLSRSLEDGSTQIRSAPTETEEWKTAFAEYEESLGELWLSGGLGGVPDTSVTQ